MNRPDILFQSDEKYAKVLAPAIKSLCVNNRDADFRIVVIDCGLSQKSRKLLQKMTKEDGRSVTFVTGDELEKEVGDFGFSEYKGYRENRVSYLKMLYPTSAMASDRILYIDCDTAVTGSIKGLLGTDLKGNVMAAALDCYTDTGHKKMIGMRPEEPFYNSGVMLIDKKRWKEEKIFENIIEQKNSGVKYNTVDQDYINIAVRGKCLTIGCRYNYQPAHIDYSPSVYFSSYHKDDLYYTPEELVKGRKHIAILHYFRYLGMHPWDKDSMHPDEKVYRKYLSMTPWRNMPIRKKKVGPAIMFERVMYRLLPDRLYLILFRFMRRTYNRLFKLKTAVTDRIKSATGK